jgi:hypothetical protein
MIKRARERLLGGTASVAVPRDDVRSAIRKAEAQGLIAVDWSDAERPQITVLDMAGLQQAIDGRRA